MRNFLCRSILAATMTLPVSAGFAQDIQPVGTDGILRVTATPDMVRKQVAVPVSVKQVVVTGARDIWCMTAAPDFQAWLTVNLATRNGGQLRQLRTQVGSAARAIKFELLFGGDESSLTGTGVRRDAGRSIAAPIDSTAVGHTFSESEKAKILTGQPVEIPLPMANRYCFSSQQIDVIVAEGLRVLDLYIPQVK